MYTRSNFTKADIVNDFERNFRQDYLQERQPRMAAPVVFTYADRTIPRFSVPEAYQQAGTVYKALRHLEPEAVVFPRDTFNSSDKRKVLTLEEFSNLVERILNGMFSR